MLRTTFLVLLLACSLLCLGIALHSAFTEQWAKACFFLLAGYGGGVGSSK